MATQYPPTHTAVVTTGKRLPLSTMEVETAAPGINEVVVHVQWTASSPLNLHQADGGLLVKPPFILGETFAGTVIATGPEDPTTPNPDSKPIEIGDQVVGFVGSQQKQAGFQTYVTVPRHLIGRIPSSIPMEEAVTAPSRLTTAIHTIATDLKLELPWPRLTDWSPKEANDPFLVWGGGSSVGLSAVQVLNHWGYKNVLAVASRRHHDGLLALGAAKCFDYRDEDVTNQINTYAPRILHIIDCIGDLEGTLRPLSRVISKGAKVAIMMPVIIRHATKELEPELSIDPVSLLEGLYPSEVDIIGVRAFSFEKNTFFKWHLQPDILPSLLESGAVKPSRVRIVEGTTLIERAQNALDLLRQRAPSGERLVWRVSEEGA